MALNLTSAIPITLFLLFLPIQSPLASSFPLTVSLRSPSSLQLPRRSSPQRGREVRFRRIHGSIPCLFKRVKVFFLWLDIVEVIRDDDELDFSVGIASASFPINNFYECPQCGCGLDCVNGKVSKLRVKSSLASI
ncbi:exocyst complex component SEC15B-like isoform X1 [Hibiscus syriacus]|uniref:Exocyst complex component SEC15B-like isoform X1 n=1 Tax=Hibiscus syriacus TaxID=106335 RepID=A0A6A3AGA0_HIBSY|nr:exocyst complex component SEC15B-like isoform X1 [Hibiscus syriacus]